MAKAALHRSGALSFARSLKARDAFTVVLFHRILPESDPRATTADWLYTARLEHFERFLDFAKSAYTIVSLKQVEHAYRSSSPLPANAMLITFDDAWEDTARYAVPALEKRGMASAIFVPTGGIENDVLIWQDVAEMLARVGLLHNNETGTGLSGEKFDALAQMPPHARSKELREALKGAGPRVTPVMMSRAQFASLPKSVDLGAHSVNHIRFTELDDVSYELKGSFDDLRKLTGAPPRSFAFPHGCYHPPHVGEAHKAGYELVFTTEPKLNRLKNGKLLSPVIARITISDYDMLDDNRHFSEAQLSYALYNRPAVVLEDVRA